MPARTKPRKYKADDLTHTVSERQFESWGESGEDTYRLKCMECVKTTSAVWVHFLFDTRAKNYYVCVNCYRRLTQDNDWKSWGVGF